MEKLLVVDDNRELLQQLKWGLGKEYRLLQAIDTEEALALFRSHHPRVVTLDLGLPPEPDGAQEGLRCLREMLKEDPDTKIIVLSGNEERANALKAVESGAYDFYSKPVDLAELRVILARAFHLAGLEAENRRLQAALGGENPTLPNLFGQSSQMLEVFATVRKVATCDVPVLILGESGTGKELVARAIHAESLRRKGLFVPINCGAIPENLLESELFGHEKGAFTGASARMEGKVEYAEQGTLFLDEIAELSMPLQVKLLRFLQDRVLQRVGGREDIAVDCRIIAATNADIEQVITAGSFREDLYYRIGVITVHLPPLRARGDDIVLLATLFLRRYAGEFKRRVRGFSTAALRCLQEHNWPGNVRELENKVKRAVILAEKAIIEPADLALAGPAVVAPVPYAGKSLREARESMEKELLAWAIEAQQGNVARAADMLGVSRPTLYDLLKKHGLFAADA